MPRPSPRALAQRADVEYAQAAYRVHAEFSPQRSVLRRPVESSRSSTWSGRGTSSRRPGPTIIVAVLDTGIAYTNATLQYHASAFRLDEDGIVEPSGPGGTPYPALGDLTLRFGRAPSSSRPAAFVAPHDFIWDDNLPVDLDGHGTHVSGTIGQLTNNSIGTAGVAFNVEADAGEGDRRRLGRHLRLAERRDRRVVARGIRYAADNGAKILNMSLGRTGSDRRRSSRPRFDYAVGKGASWPSPQATTSRTAIRPRCWPRLPRGSTAPSRGGHRSRTRAHAYYSSTGRGSSWRRLADRSGASAQPAAFSSRPRPRSRRNLHLPPASFRPPRFDVLAYFYFTGTSMATPHVSGVPRC